MHELLFDENLCLDIPDELSLIGNRDLISSGIQVIESKFSNYINFNFHYDIGINSALVSLVSQIVDDSPFKGIRSKNILNSNNVFVGITSKVVEGELCSYYLFAEESNY